MKFDLLMSLVGLLAGAIASVAGFGIGSLLTPLLAFQVGTKVAVAGVSIPHFIGTALRLWLTREHIDRRVLWSFGVTSASGGLIGALLQTRFRSIWLSYVLGALLVFAGMMGFTGLASRMRFGRYVAWVAGAISGGLGGLVGNQGGIRSAALLSFDIQRQAFVATATAIALFVDLARMPVYALKESAAVARLWPIVTVSTVGVLIGTLLGARILARVPEPIFRRIVSLIILALGISLLLRPGT